MKRTGDIKQRVDKKRDVKPTVSLEIKDILYRISSLTYMAVKDVCQRMTISVLKERKAIEYLAQYFKRDFKFESTIFYGFIENESVKKRKKEPTERVTVRFTQWEYESLARLSFALDCTISRTVALLLQIATQNIRFINAFIKDYLRETINERQLRELREILKYVGKTGESHHSWASLLALVVDEIGDPALNIKDSIEKFLNSKWR